MIHFSIIQLPKQSYEKREKAFPPLRTKLRNHKKECPWANVHYETGDLKAGADMLLRSLCSYISFFLASKCASKKFGGIFPTATRNHLHQMLGKIANIDKHYIVLSSELLRLTLTDAEEATRSMDW